MAWTTPKTNWAKPTYDALGNYTGEYFNVADYNRISGNLEHLKSMAVALYLPFPWTVMAAATLESYGYATYFDNIEKNIEAIAANCYRPPGMAATRQWYGNQNAPTWEDFNRMESTILLFYDIFTRQAANKRKLPFKLKGSDF